MSTFKVMTNLMLITKFYTSQNQKRTRKLSLNLAEGNNRDKSRNKRTGKQCKTSTKMRFGCFCLFVCLI